MISVKTEEQTQMTESGLLQTIVLSLLLLCKLYVVYIWWDMCNDCINQNYISNNIKSYGWFKMREKKTKERNETIERIS